MHDLIVWMGTHFDPERYLFWTRVQCTLWTMADFVIVFCLIRIGDLGRRFAGRPVHRGCYWILAATVPFAVWIPFVDSKTRIFVLELLVTIPHFSLLLYVPVKDGQAMVNLLYVLGHRLFSSPVEPRNAFGGGSEFPGPDA